MKYIYEEQIVMVLTKVGEGGLPLALLVKNIFNLNCTLFERPNWNQLYLSIQQYMRRNSSSPHSLYEKIGWGRYRMRPGAKSQVVQQRFVFSDDIEQEDHGRVSDQANVPSIESPSLFPFFDDPLLDNESLDDGSR